ncbi:DsbA family protein [Mariniluteicoccus flavus]
MNGGHPPKKNGPVVAIVAGVVVLLLAIGGFAAWRALTTLSTLPGRTPTTGSPSTEPGVPPHATAARDGIVANPGKGSGKPVVKVYADYQCPACGRFEKLFGDVLDDMAAKGEVGLEVHTMTFLDTNLRNDSSARAANAAACADVAGHYAAYHRALFAHQPAQEGDGFTDNQLTGEIAEAAGISGAAINGFRACVREQRHQAFVKGVDTTAAKDGITSTPTLTVNGKKLATANLTADPQSLRAEIMRLAR